MSPNLLSTFAGDKFTKSIDMCLCLCYNTVNIGGDSIVGLQSIG